MHMQCHKTSDIQHGWYMSFSYSFLPQTYYLFHFLTKQKLLSLLSPLLLFVILSQAEAAVLFSKLFKFFQFLVD